MVAHLNLGTDQMISKLTVAHHNFDVEAMVGKWQPNMPFHHSLVSRDPHLVGVFIAGLGKIS
jgi:hypothetical protein